MLAIGFMAYNFAKKHMTLKQTPAQAAGVTDRQWTMQDIICMMDEHHEAKQAAEFEAAFAARYTPGRATPKSYQPTPKANIPLPWYLDMTRREKPPQEELP